ncbi:CRISPR-associated helicase Cas3', partial [Nonomuraea sp. RK-328]|nr:CRISPR-associated helicase Cas3' [Nonomuraea sp. RK-328]
MAQVLWDHYLPHSLKRFIANALAVTPEEAGRLVAFWAGLHDIGKCMACFQAMDAEAYERLDGYPEINGERRRHEYAAHVWLSHPLARLGYDARSSRGIAFLVAQVLGGHHGRFSARDHRECRYAADAVLPELGDGKWEEQRQAILAAITEILSPPPPPRSMSIEAAALVCGTVILADWLVSQDDHLAQRLPDIPATAAQLGEHHQESMRLAPDLMAEAGLSPVRLRNLSFNAEFPEIERPNDLQCSVAEHLPALLRNGPGLLLVTAPMGVGKTEVAFHGARLLGQANGTPGFLFALPTMATADQMYGRARTYGQRQAEDDAALSLLHSMSWLNDAYTGTGTDPTVVTEDVSLSAPEWLHGRKRGMLASMAVCTIDQVLLTVLPLKHLPLRMLGLAGKVLIVDEVHAYDAYMQELLRRALTWLGHLGVPVVLMSATLPARVAERLVTSYLRGAGHPDKTLPRLSYPGWAYADANSGEVKVFEVESPRRSLTIERRQAPVKGSALDRSEILRDILTPIVTEGGCVGIVCNTVAEAQETYTLVRNWFDGLDEAPELTLLHARFPARRREELTTDITRKFGKCRASPDLATCVHRPKAAVVVATQVIEQSLDLDFDLVVSDLAPIALLLQRAGRCQRHEGRIRPAWVGEPRLVVLRPSDAYGSLTLPRSWPFVYSPSLLRRTDEQINQRVITIPDDVQGLVDKVYDDAFADGEMSDEDLEWVGKEIAESSLADLIAIPGPAELSGLHQLTSSEASEDMIATRLGADSIRVLCAYQGPDDALYLDAACSVRLPDAAKIPRRVVKTILAETIPLRSSFRRGRDAINEPPASWRSNAWLRDLVIVHLRKSADGSHSGQVGSYENRLDTHLGLQLSEGCRRDTIPS